MMPQNLNANCGNIFARDNWATSSFVVRQQLAATSLILLPTIASSLSSLMEDNIHNNRKRSDWLLTQGFRTIRFWNHDVFENIEGVLRVIAKELGLPD